MTHNMRFEPLTPEHWPSFTELFGANGACGGCWCMVWRVPSRDWNRRKGAPNRDAMRRLVKRGPPPGILAFEKGVPVGWCAVGRREEYVRLETSRVLKPVDARPVWSVSCLYVRRDRRHRGLSVALLRAAAEFAAGLGAEMLEGYPVEPKSDSIPDVFAWTGTARAYLKAGFQEVHRWSATRPIMRLDLLSARATD